MRSIAYVIVTLLLSAALTAVLTSIPPQVADASTPDVISNSSTIPYPPDEARVEAPKPVEMPADVVTPAEMASVERGFREHGWALGAIIGVIALSRALRRARRRWPESRVLAWIGGKAGVVIGALAIVATAALDALVLSGSWLTAGYAAIGTVLYLLDPDQRQPAPIREHPRAPTERGAGAGPLIAILAGLAVVLGAGYLASCSSVRRHARDTAGAIVDCTTETARAHAREYGTLLEQVLRAATSPDGSVDTEPLKRAAATFGLETGACSLATVISRAMAVPEPHGLLATSGPSRAERLRAAWEAVRAERFGGARFRVELGTL